MRAGPHKSLSLFSFLRFVFSLISKWRIRREAQNLPQFKAVNKSCARCVSELSDVTLCVKVLT